MNFLENFSKELISSIQNMALLDAVIVVIAIISIKALRSTIESIFNKSKMSTPAIVTLVGVVNLLITIAVIVVFDGQGTILNTILFTGIVFITSWAMSIFAYETIMRAVFDLLETLTFKVKDLKTDMKFELIQSENKLLQLERLNKELMKEIVLEKEVKTDI